MKCSGERQKKECDVVSPLTNTRRDFIKLCGAATVGGISGILSPPSAEADDALPLPGTTKPAGVDNEFYWNLVRRQFALKPGLTYMNTGTEGSMPRIVLSRMSKYARAFAANPWDTLTDEVLGLSMKGTRGRVAEFLGADLDEIVLTMNTTEGMSFTANGLDLVAGDEVLTTLHEHLAGYCCWELLRERRGVTLTQIELPTPANNKEEIIAVFQEAITPQTRVMSFCHINYTTGLRMPVRELCQLAQDHGIISVVDGAHAIGMININLHDLGCDVYATSPHKWLNAPPGTGVLYMRKGVQDLLWPTVTETSASCGGPNVFQYRGQMCSPAYACINDVIDFQTKIGKDVIEARILALSSYLKELIIDRWGADALFSPTEEGLSSGLVSFNPFDDPFDREKIRIYHRLRDEYHIIIRSVDFKDRHAESRKWAMRVSTHIYNNFKQIEALISALETLMAAP